jgi:lysophospholipase L1-like esterase
MNDRTKKIILISVLGIILVTLTSVVIVRQVRKRRGRLNGGEDSVPVKNSNPKTILIVGDSQSAIKNAKGGNITYSYPNILKEKLKSSGVTIDVLALGGKTTKWMLENLPSQLAKKKYDRVIIYGGGNDTSNASIPLDTTISNIQKMVDLSRENGADSFVNLGYKVEGKFGDINILPVGRPANLLKKKEDWIPYVQKRKDLQKLIPEKITNATFIPVYDLESKTTDGIHPTSAGHKIVAEKIYESILKKY